MPEENKRFFFLQLPHDFFRSRRIKKMRRLQDGDTLIIIYLKLQLLSLNTGGLIQFSDMDGDLASEISAEIDEDEELVSAALDYLTSHDLAKLQSEDSVFLPYVEKMTSSHTASTERSRKSRNNKKLLQSCCNATEMQHDCNENETQEKKIRREEERNSIDKSIDLPSPSVPTLQQTNLSISDEIDRCTGIVQRKDVRRILEAWNVLGLTNIKEIKPDTMRGGMVKKRIQDNGVDSVLEAIENVKNSDFLMGRTPERFKITFDWFIRPNNCQKVLEGNYADTPKRTYADTDMPLRAARTLGRLVSERTGLPKPKERELQIWAAELEDCVAENETDFDQLADLMAFSQENPFWRKNVIDATSLRKHYRKMMADMNDGGKA